MTNRIILRLLLAFNQIKRKVKGNDKSNDKNKGQDKILDQHLHDLRIAREIQQQFIPKHPISINNYKISSLYLPSNQLSGDFLDYVDLGDNKFGILVIDVIGKGIQSSFTTILIKSIFQQIIVLREPQTPKAMMTVLNTELYRQVRLNRKGGYGFYGVIDTKQHTLSYCHCGIGVARLYRSINTIELAEYGGVGVGLIENTEYTEGIIDLFQNDILFISTDGIEDVKDKAGNRLGSKWVDVMIKKGRNDTSLLDQIEGELKRITGNIEDMGQRDDDIACVCVELY